MKLNYGESYILSEQPRRRVEPYWVYRRCRTGRYLVYEIHSKKQFELFPTKERAQYVVARLNGMDELATSMLGDLCED